MELKWCPDLTEHEPHVFTTEEVQVCNGQTVCGAISHVAHTINRRVEHYCRGVCNCVFRSRPHGPGDHK